MVIWKFPIDIRDKQLVEMPECAEILTVQVQHGQPCLWASVDPSRKREWRRIFTVGTGHWPKPLADWRYIGTYQLSNGDLVYHIFANG